MANHSRSSRVASTTSYAARASVMLHEPMHVTAGKRYVLLSFLYGET